MSELEVKDPEPKGVQDVIEIDEEQEIIEPPIQPMIEE
jgi:hypothetical protein